jgi:hypothetical protein
VVLAARATGLPSGICAVEAGTGDAQDFGFEAVAQSSQAVNGAVGERVHGEFGCFGQADDAGDVFGSSATAALVASTDEQ